MSEIPSPVRDLTSRGDNLLNILRYIQSFYLFAEEPELVLDPLPQWLTAKHFWDPSLNVEILLIANAFAIVAAISCIIF